MENNNDGRENVFYEKPISEEKVHKKGKSATIIIVAIVILAVSVFGVFAFSNIGSKLFASKSERFFQLATVDQKLLSLLEADNNKAQVNTELEIEVDKILKDFEIDTVELGSFLIETKNIVKEEDYSNVTTVKLDEIDGAKLDIQVVKTGDLIGVHIPEITEKFIAVDIGDFEGLMENLDKLGLELDNDEFDIESKIENLEILEEQQRELIKLLEKYVKVMQPILDDFIEVEKDVEIKVDNKTEKATEHKLTINEKTFVKVGKAIIETLLNNQKDIDKLVELGVLPKDEKEDFIEELEFLLGNINEAIQEESYEGAMNDINEIVIKLYEKNDKNIATVFEIDDIEIGLYVFEKQNDYDLILRGAAEDAEILLILQSDTKGNETTNELVFAVKSDGERHEATLCKTKTEKLDKAEDEMIKIKKSDVLLLNVATEEELENYVTEISGNVEEFINKFSFGEFEDYNQDMSTFPAEEIIDEQIYDNSIGNNVNISNGKLAEAQRMYNKIKLGMSKADVISAIGQPTNSMEFYRRNFVL